MTNYFFSLLSYLRSELIFTFNQVSGFRGESPDSPFLFPCAVLPRGETKSPGFQLSLRISPDERVISVKSNKIVCFYSRYGLYKTINWHQLDQNDHRRQLLQLSQTLIIVG